MTTPVELDYLDRKTGLVIFGILEIGMGALCGIGILLMILGQVVASRSANPPPPMHVLVPVFGMYLVAALTFVSLGVGSILARRWARALLLCFSAVALVGGSVACVSMAFMLPRMFDAIAQQGRVAPQPGALLAMKIVATSFAALFYVVIPGALFLFYRSRHVKRTCEVRDPVERWTDHCPLPVLAFSLVMGIFGIFVLCVATQFHVFPLFGVFITGGAGLLICIMVGGLLLYLAWAFYRLQTRAWWLALAMQVIAAASAMATFWNGNLTEMYAKMGVDQRAAAMSVQMMAGPTFKWVTAFSVLPWLVWLLCIRGYFYRPPEPPVLTSSEAPSGS